MGLADPDEDPGLNPMQSLHRQIRSLPQITIAKLRGRLRGGGAELAAAHDMRFAAAGETWISQVESRLGIFPGGGGTQLLTPLVGRARALEIVLGGELFDSEVAERYGWVNRSVPPAALDDFVASLAGRIAAMPAGAANAAREAVDAAALGAPRGCSTACGPRGRRWQRSIQRPRRSWLASATRSPAGYRSATRSWTWSRRWIEWDRCSARGPRRQALGPRGGLGRRPSPPVSPRAASSVRHRRGPTPTGRPGARRRIPSVPRHRRPHRALRLAYPA